MTVDGLIASWAYNVIDNRGGPSQLLYGYSGDDLMLAGDNNDDMRGRDGNDCLIGGDGNDILKGMNGNVIHIWSGGDGGYTGYNGDDYVDGGWGAA